MPQFEPVNSKVTAEQNFRAAFERLKRNEPIVVPKGTSVSQNNVALEAGCKATALKRARHGELVSEIQTFIQGQLTKLATEEKPVLKVRRTDEELLASAIMQRDMAQSKLISAQMLITDLLDEVKILRANQEPSSLPFRAR